MSLSVCRCRFRPHIRLIGSAMLSTLINRVRAGESAVELVWSSHERWPLPRVSGGDDLRVAILDSSFNPPTRAHLALATAPYPTLLQPWTSALQESRNSAYDATLLLLSVRNADKQLAPGDASYVQRLEMMILLAQDIVLGRGRLVNNDTPGLTREYDNVAVAIIDEPTFVGKSRSLLQFLRHHLSRLFEASAGVVPSPADNDTPATMLRTVLPRLAFLVGVDTLERLFAPRYYMSEDAMLAALRNFFSSDGDNARVVCARRNLSEAMRKEVEDDDIVPGAAQEFVGTNHVTLIDIGDFEKTISSTKNRLSLKTGDSVWRSMVHPSVAEYILEHGLYCTPA